MVNRKIQCLCFCWLFLLLLFFNHCSWHRVWWKYFWMWPRRQSVTRSRMNGVVMMTRTLFRCCWLCFIIMFSCCFSLLMLFWSDYLFFIVPMIEKCTKKICSMVYICKIPAYNIRSKIRVLDFGGHFCPIFGKEKSSSYLGTIAYILIKLF